MLNAVLSGILLGFILSVLIGPVFFMLIKTSIYDGFKSAMYLELGISLSDAVCIFFSYLGLASLLQNPAYKPIISWVGGIVLIVFGIVTFLQKVKIDKKLNIAKRDDYLKLVVRGFLFNITNPSVIFFWIGSVGLAVSEFEGRSFHIFIYFFSTLLVVISIDILKAKLAMRLSKSITDAKLILLGKIAGIGIMLFGVAVIVKLYIRS